MTDLINWKDMTETEMIRIQCTMFKADLAALQYWYNEIKRLENDLWVLNYDYHSIKGVGYGDKIKIGDVEVNYKTPSTSNPYKTPTKNIEQYEKESNQIISSIKSCKIKIEYVLLMLNKIKEPVRSFVIKRYVDNKDYQEIAIEANLDRSRVSRKSEKAIKSLFV